MHCSWRFSSTQGGQEPADIDSWARELNISCFLARLLWHRGYCSPRDMDLFLSPGLRHLPGLQHWPQLEEAAQCLAAELGRGKTLAVWGDYDVDGLTSTALVLDFLRRRGCRTLYHIPHRLNEGYGLNLQGLRELASQGAEILLSVDCGVADLEEVQQARELGLQVVITDHHLPGNRLPEAQAVVNPKLGDCGYSNLAGVGVVFLLLCRLNRLLPGEPLDMRQYLDLVALGTIADVVELSLENRILVKNGLLVLQEAKRPGIFALKEISRLPPTASLGSCQVGFSLAPRLNAAGRMGETELALDLLLAPDLSTARPLAVQLDKLNQKRQQQEQGILDQAMEQAEEQKQSPGLVLYAEDWHPGIIGIVASRVAERFYRPVLLLTRDGEGLKGSGRSIPEFDLFQGLKSCASCLRSFGGHHQAAGLSLEHDKLQELQELFPKAVTVQLGPDLPGPSLQLEARLGLNLVDLQLVQELDLLQPFGPGNSRPLFCSPALKVQKYKVIGQNHVSLQLRDEKAGVSMSGKAWRQAENLGPEVAGGSLQLAFTPQLNHFNGLTSIDLVIRDWRCLGQG
ncbi:MAG: single-stranded-DNA-specific exonuclease RecJ [Desulfohalobiaceae bacterium]